MSFEPPGFTEVESSSATDFGFRALGLGFKVWGLGLKVYRCEGSGLHVLSGRGLRLWVRKLALETTSEFSKISWASPTKDLKPFTVSYKHAGV